MQTGTYNARVGTGNSRGNTSCTRFVACGHACKSSASSTIIIFIGTIVAKLKAFCNGIILGLSIADSSIHLPYCSCICLIGAISQAGNLITADVHIAATDGGLAVRTEFDLGTCCSCTVGSLIADRSDARQVLSQLDFQFSIHVVHADVIFCHLLSVGATDDIDGVIQFLGNDFISTGLAIVAGKFQAVFHSSYLVVSSRIFIYNAGNAILAINTVSAFDTFRFLVFALLDGNINFCILAVRTGRSYEANGPRSAVFTIFSRCANNNLGHSSIEGLIHRTAGNELLAAVRFFIRGVRISNLTRTNGFAPCIFIGFLLVCCRIGFRDRFSIVTDGVGLQVTANIGCVRFGIRFQLFHDHGIMGINAVSGFDEAVVVGRLICCIFCSNRILSVIVPRPICIG